jgi:hypothetical protein
LHNRIKVWVVAKLGVESLIKILIGDDDIKLFEKLKHKTFYAITSLSQNSELSYGNIINRRKITELI